MPIQHSAKKLYKITQDIGEQIEGAATHISHCCAALTEALPQYCTPENVRIGSAFITEYSIKGTATIITNKVYARIAQSALGYAAGTATKAGKAIFEVTSRTTQRMAQFASTAGTAIGTSKYISVTSKFFSAKKNDFVGLAQWAHGKMKPCKQLTGLLAHTSITVTDDFLKHLFTAELKTYIKRSGHIIKKLSGFHHFKKGTLEEMGIQLLNSKICKKTGIILADVLCEGHVEPDKTFFPSKWSQKTIIKKIREALEHAIKIEEGADRIKIQGQTTEGIIIQLIVDKAGKLITAYPDKLSMVL